MEWTSKSAGCLENGQHVRRGFRRPNPLAIWKMVNMSAGVLFFFSARGGSPNFFCSLVALGFFFCTLVAQRVFFLRPGGSEGFFSLTWWLRGFFFAPRFLRGFFFLHPGGSPPRAARPQKKNPTFSKPPDRRTKKTS